MNGVQTGIANRDTRDSYEGSGTEAALARENSNEQALQGSTG
jgi:hypothetical protein